MSRLALAAVVAFAVAAAPAVASAQAPQTLPPAPPGTPTVAAQDPVPGQAGKDVIWLPTPESVVERMLTMAQVGARDVVYDLGAGDGRMVIAAAKRGAEAVGVEFNPELVAFAERNARQQGVSTKAKFVQGDIFATDFSRATVVTLYLLSTLNERLRPTILKMKPGTRVVSHAFSMGDWTPDEASQADSRNAYLWIVPAQVDGAWRLQLTGGPTFDLTLKQTYQKVEGSLALGGVTAGVRHPQLRGDRIQFAFIDGQGVQRELTGKVAGDRMEGTFTADGGASGRWTATRP